MAFTLDLASLPPNFQAPMPEAPPTSKLTPAETRVVQLLAAYNDPIRPISPGKRSSSFQVVVVEATCGQSQSAATINTAPLQTKSKLPRRYSLECPNVHAVNGQRRRRGSSLLSKECSQLVGPVERAEMIEALTKAQAEASAPNATALALQGTS